MFKLLCVLGTRKNRIRFGLSTVVFAAFLLFHQSVLAIPPGDSILHLTDGGEDQAPALSAVFITGTAPWKPAPPTPPAAIQPSRPTGSERGSGGGGSPGPADPGQSEAEKPASDGNTDPGSCANGQNPNPSSQFPVIIATGEKYKDQQDFAAGSVYGLSLSRTYRSFGSTSTMFGPKWLSQYDYSALSFSGCYSNPDYGNLCIPQTVYLYASDRSDVYLYPHLSLWRPEL
ncbi:DUF6531 domain-containing protein [Rhodoferax sp.]|uniref:DUF6531 domain-containing protein n=1 Tax=Rhodoferax sp. TaxID=50421 RepID=UPI00345B7741